MNTYLPPLDPNTMPGDLISPGGIYLFEITGQEGLDEAKRHPRTAADWLRFMIARREVYGTPLPDNFVPPPGIDFAELMKRLPPERPRPAGE